MRARAFRARVRGRLPSLEVRASGVFFKVVVRCFEALGVMAPAGKGRLPAGVNRVLLEKSGAAGMKLIREPSQVGHFQLL